jgi:hypothetical protein
LPILLKARQNRLTSSMSTSEMIGHCGTDGLKRTAAIHGLRLKGDLKVCEDGAVAKARHNQDWKERVKHLVKEFI